MKKRIQQALLSALMFALFASPVHAQFVLSSGQRASIAIRTADEKPVASAALAMLQADMAAVMGDTLEVKSEGGDIVAATISSPLLSGLQREVVVLEGKREAFTLRVLPDHRLLIAGSDSHGLAYGLLELSRLMGVSPWEWWADCSPRRREHFSLEANFVSTQHPSVDYRGIFVNDEDWGLLQWARNTMEPQGEYGVGRIGPKTNERIFQLMLRLRANYYWPAMHEASQPFFLTQGNRETAARYGIYIGGSHCEPMASSTAGEWSKRGRGAYNYVTNAKGIQKFWADRLKEVSGQEIVYTLGMRGVHDSGMQGAKTVDEQREVLSQVIADQRTMLAQYVDSDVTRVPQVFIPYKEILDVYRSGLQVPDDVTLMWCDDNYGYLRHFPSADEAKRSGGNGVYYHVSYWGRPHDYLWLGTQSPYLLYQQMKEGYDRGIRKMWILNVGDIKPAEYQIELFMDMAWDMEQVARQGVSSHMEQFLAREFGEGQSARLQTIMQEHYRLAYIHKPEFMGGTRTEEGSNYRIVVDLPFSLNEINQRIDSYQQLSDEVEAIGQAMPADRIDAFFQLVKYPVQGAAQMNFKTLYGQLSRHDLAPWSKSDAAYDSIQTLTRQYNQGFGNNGKWNRMMDSNPRRLPVFFELGHEKAVTQLTTGSDVVRLWNAAEGQVSHGHSVEGLGYGSQAVQLNEKGTISFSFEAIDADTIEVEACFVPTHPINDKSLRFSISLDGATPVEADYAVVGRSEEWKENVLWNQAKRSFRLPLKAAKRHKLVLRAIDDGVVVDQLRLLRKN